MLPNPMQIDLLDTRAANDLPALAIDDAKRNSLRSRHAVWEKSIHANASCSP